MTRQSPHLLKLHHFTYTSLYLYVSVSTLSVCVISTSVLIPTPILVPIPTLISPVGYCLSDGGGLAKSCLTLATSWTVTCQAPLWVGFPRQEYWSGLPFSSLGDFPNRGIKTTSPGLKVDSNTEPHGNLPCMMINYGCFLPNC